MDWGKVLEDHAQELFYSIDTHDITMLPIGTVPLVRLLSKVASVKVCMVSDDTSYALWYNDMPYHDSIYHSRFPGRLGDGSIWIKYDVAIHCFTQLSRFDFILLDGVDTRSLNSDFFLALLGKLRIRSKIVIPLQSSFQGHLYKGYLETLEYSVNLLDLRTVPCIDVYHSASAVTHSRIHTEILKVVKQLLDLDTLTDMYDILTIVPSRSEISRLSDLIKTTFTNRDFSIITDVKGYSTNGSHRRIIILTRSSDFFNVSHRVKYIIDSGFIEVTKVDPNGLLYCDIQQTNKNTIQQRLSILHMEGSKLFVMQRDEELADFHHEILCRPLLCHLLQTMKFDFKFAGLPFLTAPSTDQLSNAASQLCYMGLLTINDDEYLFTEDADALCHFQFSSKPQRLALFLSLVHSKKLNCTDELLKIVAFLSVVSASVVANQISNHEFDKTLVSNESDFFTILNVYNHLIKEQRPKFKLDPFTKDLKKEIKHQFVELEKYTGSSSPVSGNEVDLQKALILGFQFQTGTLKLGDRMVLTPVTSYREANIELVMKKSPHHGQELHEGDLFIFAEYDLDWSQDGTQRAYAAVCARIDKEIALATTKSFRKV